MKILVTGSSTPLGSAVIEHFFSRGDTIYSFSNLGECTDNLRYEILSAVKHNPIDIVFLLHGEEIYYSPLRNSLLQKRKNTLLSIHKDICKLLSASSSPPKLVFLGSSSVVAVKKDDESLSFIKSFYTELEEQTHGFSKSGCRCLLLRMGKIISNLEGNNANSLPHLKNTAFSPQVYKKQPTSWISVEDALRALVFLLEKDTYSGVVNITSGENLSYGELNLLLSKKKKMRHLSIPLFFMNLLLGKACTSLLHPLDPASPNKLIAGGFNINNIFLSEYLDILHQPKT